MTLVDFLKNIADGIREKEKSAKPIPAAQYASRLKALQTVNDEFDAILMIHTSADNGNIYGIESYKSLTIVEGAVGSKAFTGYNALENVTIGNGVTAIEGQAFYNCRNLTSVTIGNSVTSIGNSAFENCQSLVNITYVGTMAEWEAIEKGGYWNISTGEYTIYCIDGEIGKITVEDTEASIGLELALNKDGISYSVTGIGTCTDTDIIIPRFYDNKFVTGIGDHAFSFCKTVTSITIPDGVTSIGRSAFGNCYALTSINIPDSVTSIGNGAFDECTKITSVYITDIKAWCDISFGNSVANPCNYSADLYLNGEKITNLVIPDTVNTINDYAFHGYESLESVTIPDSVKSISANALSWCSSLTSITVDENNPVYHSAGNCLIETASKTLILGCVTSVIPDDESVTSIGKSAFGGCASLTSINIPNGITKIGEGAFWGCSALTSISIPDSVTSIGDWAFEYCFELIYNEYNNGKYLGNSNNPYVVLCEVIDKNVSSFEIHENAKIIGERALTYCNLLTDINIGDSVTSIETFAFSWNDLLTSVTFKGTPKFIKENAFNQCYNLLTINAPWAEGEVAGAPWSAVAATINYNYSEE